MKFSPLIIISISDFFYFERLDKEGILVQFISAVSVPLEFPFVSFDLKEVFHDYKSQERRRGEARTDGRRRGGAAAALSKMKMRVSISDSGD